MAAGPAERVPEYVDDEPIKKIQEIEAARHNKIDTFEQARLDAIARLAMADSNGFASSLSIEQRANLQKAQQKQIESIQKRQPEFVAADVDAEVRHIQQIEAAKHDKINTFEQERLNMMARLAMADSNVAGLNDDAREKLMKAADAQKRSILAKSGDLINATMKAKGQQGTKSRQERSIDDDSNIDNTNNNIGNGINGIANGNGNDYSIDVSNNSAMYGFNYENEDRSDLPFMSIDNRLKKLELDMNNMDQRYRSQLKDMQEKYELKIENLKLKIESDKVLLRNKDEHIAVITKENAIRIKELEKSKYNLIKSTAKEIDSLRRQIKMYNKGKIVFVTK